MLKLRKHYVQYWEFIQLKENIMVKVSLLVVLLLLSISGCAAPAPTVQDWQQDVLDKQYQELTGQIQKLQKQSQGKDKQIAQLMADKANQANQIKQLQGELSARPTNQQLQSLREHVTSLSEVLAITQSDLARVLNQSGYSSMEYENLRNEYNRLVGILTGVNNRTDEVTATDNITIARNTLFYETWDKWYQSRNISQFQIKK